MEELFLKYKFKLKRKSKPDTEGIYYATYEREIRGIGTYTIHYCSLRNNTDIDLRNPAGHLKICTRYEPETEEQMEFLLTGSSRLLLIRNT